MFNADFDSINCSSQEELEEEPEVTVYDNYKFLTKEDIERLKLTHYIGTPFLKAYMHGFFINYKLYNQVTIFLLLLLVSLGALNHTW